MSRTTQPPYAAALCYRTGVDFWSPHLPTARQRARGSPWRMSFASTAGSRQARVRRPASIDLPADRGLGEDAVVSWKLAAEMKESVLSEALVMPRRSGWPLAGFLPAAMSRSLSDSSTMAVSALPAR